MKFIIALVFILVPIAEIATFIQVGGLIGLWPTLLAIVVTALLGVALLRQQGLSTLSQAQAARERGEFPIEPIIHGLFLLVAGAFLLTPGFITDAAGFILLVPSIRLTIARAMWRRLRDSENVHVVVEGTAREEFHPDRESDDHDRRGPTPDGPVIEGKVVGNEDSPWRNRDGGTNDDKDDR